MRICKIHSLPMSFTTAYVVSIPDAIGYNQDRGGSLMHHSIKLYGSFRSLFVSYYIFQAKWVRIPMIGRLVRKVANLHGSYTHGAYLLTLEEAIRAYTLDAAYCIDSEAYLGSIEVDKRADLIVLDTDIFEATPEQIAETKVLATMMNGKEVYLSEEAKRMLEEHEDFEFHN